MHYSTTREKEPQTLNDNRIKLITNTNNMEYMSFHCYSSLYVVFGLFEGDNR